MALRIVVPVAAGPRWDIKVNGIALSQGDKRFRAYRLLSNRERYTGVPVAN